VPWLDAMYRPGVTLIAIPPLAYSDAVLSDGFGV